MIREDKKADSCVVFGYLNIRLGSDKINLKCE